MKANELRIGNFVQGPLGEVAQITQLGHKDNPNYIEAKNEFFHGQNGFSPIPLTEEWLLKFGFEKDGGEWKLFPCFEIQIIVFNEDKYNRVMFYTRTAHSDFVPIFSNNDINNVHQLQNLYFALTGEELTLKEP